MLADLGGRRASDSLLYLPLIARLVTDDPDHERAALMALGAAGVVIKPFDPMTLGGQVRDLLEDRAGD